MALSAGTRLGPYEILEPLGAGGMGEVYRARDEKLGRDVALKMLPLDVLSDAPARKHFRREAEALVRLSHPHIATLFDVDSTDGVDFLVMELVPGATLEQRLRAGPLPEKEVVRLGTQLLRALVAAHGHGVVHRDLKPSNLALTEDGLLKVLDFGLARLVRMGTHGAESEATQTQTVGQVVGSPPYMAPEQVRGRETDERTDLYAAGAVLFELATGRRVFGTRSGVDLTDAILHKGPPSPRSVAPSVSPGLEALILKALDKDPELRYQTAKEMLVDLERLQQHSGAVSARDEPTAVRVASSTPSRAWKRGAMVAVAATLLLAAAWMLRPSSTPSPVVRSLLEVQPAEEVNAGNNWMAPPGGSRTALAWLPGGRTLVFVGRRNGVQELWTRNLAEDEARPLAGTEGATAPAVSPDGQWVAFWADGAIRKVPLSGGPVAILAASVLKNPFGMTWGANGELFYGHPLEGSIRRVTPDGRTEVVTTSLETTFHSLPSLLPGGEVLLFTVRKRVYTWGDEVVVAQVLATGKRSVLLSDAVDARYVPTGHLVFMRRGVLFAVPFDPKRLAVEGSPIPLLDGVSQAIRSANIYDQSGVGQFAVASTGALAYIAGDSLSYPDRRLVSVDRTGHETSLSAPPRSYGVFTRVSPDGRRFTVVIDSVTEKSGWVFDAERDTLTRLTREGEILHQYWTAEGRRIVIDRLRGGGRGLVDLFLVTADSSEAPEMLTPDAGVLCSWSPNGRRFATVKAGDIWVGTLNGSKPTLQRVTDTPYDEGHPEFSPDGRWLAYSSKESGRWEVYVQPWPGPGPRQQVSVDGGSSPAWNPNGREMFFVDVLPNPPGACGAMMVVDVKMGPALGLGHPRTLFKWTSECPACSPIHCYDVAPDGQRFYKTEPLPAPEPAPVTHIHLIQNWLGEVETRVPRER